MSRILRALGLSLGAMAALVAVMAPAAHAETGALTASQYPAFITGEQLPGITFDIGAGPARTVQCGIAKLDATIMAPTDPVTFKPTYAGCTSAGMPATVTVNGCDYTVGVSKPNTTGIAVPTTGRLHASLNCPPGQQLEIHVYETPAKHVENITTCRYDVGSQGPVLAGVYHNVPGAAPPDILATVNATFNMLNTQGPMMVCGGMAFQNVPITLTGNYTMRGFEDNEGAEEVQIPIHIG